MIERIVIVQCTALNKCSIKDGCKAFRLGQKKGDHIKAFALCCLCKNFKIVKVEK